MKSISWPDGKRFAFTIFDDTDRTTMQNGPEIYKLLCELGMLTTKSVWPIKGALTPKIGGATCEESNYLVWVRRLKELGFEIALHNATYHTSKREDIIRGLEIFKSHFGNYPKIQVNHADCADSIYWGDARLSSINKIIYNLLTRFGNHGRFKGDVESSEMFWGDRCKRDIKYVRNFTYSEINTLKVCPSMPYFDPERPLVNYWFASSEGPNCKEFCKTISEKNQDRLEDEGGACIMYTHFGASDFYQNKQLNADFRKLMERLSRKSGWFVPASRLLDYLQQVNGHKIISRKERFELEFRWLMEKVFIVGGTS